MTIKLNHTIVHARDKRASAEFMADILGLGEPVPFGPFLGVVTANDVTLDFLETDEEFIVEHYAFLVSDAEFDEIFGRIQARRLPVPGPTPVASSREGQHARWRARHLLPGSERTPARDPDAPVRQRGLEPWLRKFAEYASVIPGSALARVIRNRLPARGTVGWATRFA